MASWAKRAGFRGGCSNRADHLTTLNSKLYTHLGTACPHTPHSHGKPQGCCYRVVGQGVGSIPHCLRCHHHPSRSLPLTVSYVSGSSEQHSLHLLLGLLLRLVALAWERVRVMARVLEKGRVWVIEEGMDWVWVRAKGRVGERALEMVMEMERERG